MKTDLSWEDCKYSQEMDSLFIRLFGSWSNPVLHLSPSELARIAIENKWIDEILRARHLMKIEIGNTLVEEFVCAKVYGITRNKKKVALWHDHTATGIARRDFKTLVPYVHIMDNKTFKLVWINMHQFKGFIGRQYYCGGRKSEW